MFRVRFASCKPCLFTVRLFFVTCIIMNVILLLHVMLEQPMPKQVKMKLAGSNPSEITGPEI